MPGGDQTGPNGQGAMTGRQMGRCAGAVPMGTAGQGRGLGRGQGRGRRLGAGGGQGRGLGQRFAPPAPPATNQGFVPPATNQEIVSPNPETTETPKPVNELQELREEAAAAAQRLVQIEKRLNELQTDAS